MIVLLFSLFSFQLSWAKSNHYISSCFNDYTFGTTIPFYGNPESNTFRPDCAPDVLYSWQKAFKINKKNISSSPVLNKKFLFTWRTPLGTFGYGDTLIRLKLKDTVKFKWIKMGQSFSCPQADQDNTVYVHTYSFGLFLLNAVDYILCSGKPVESWSIGLPETQEEALSELKYLEENRFNIPQSFDSYSMGYLRSRPLPANVFYRHNPYFVSWDYDLGHDWSSEALKRKIQGITSSVNRGLYCHAPKECTVAKHLKSHSRSYFNKNHSREKSESK